jgi:hypothetical protein
MLFKDLAGNELSKGDTVSLAIGSELGAGQIVDLQTGLGLDGSGKSEPSILITIAVVRQAFPNGLVPGVLKIATPKPTVTT